MRVASSGYRSSTVSSCWPTTLGSLQQLNSLLIRSCSLGKNVVSLIETVVNQLDQVKTIDISNNGIKGGGTLQISTLLAALPQLEDLSLARNQLFENGAKFLSPVLKHCDTLVHLDLSANFFVNVESVTMWLPFLLYLRTLKLSENALGPDDVDALAEALGGLSLEKLDLSVNSFGSKGNPYCRRELQVNQRVHLW